jgi:dihydroorotate dehydrogenase (fumarate)
MTADLSTRYLGLNLATPLIASASPMTANSQAVATLQTSGAGAIVLPSLFEEQIEWEEMNLHGMHQSPAESHPESLSYFPDLKNYNTGPDGYLRQLELLKRTVEIPVIASLNGSTTGGWTRFASLIEDSGADALELNIYLVPTSPHQSSTDIESRYLEIVHAVRQQIDIPLAVKIGPYITALPNFIRQLCEAGANGVVLFNRYLHPDVDVENGRVEPTLHLSTSEELRLALRWIGILRDQTSHSLAATGGVHTVGDVLKAIAVGADVVMLTSALLQHGATYMGSLRDGLANWLAEHEYESVTQLRGSISQAYSGQPEAFQRANYTRAITASSGNIS